MEITDAGDVSDDLESVGMLQSFRTLRILRLSKFVRIIRLLANRGGVDVEGIDPSIVTMAKTLFFQFLFWHWSGLLWWVIGGEGHTALIGDSSLGPVSVRSPVRRRLGWGGRLGSRIIQVSNSK